MEQTFSSVSSMASSLSFSLPPFLRILSQKVASSSALELPATPLLQKTSKASLSAYNGTHNIQMQRNTCVIMKTLKPISNTNLMKKSVILETIIHISQVFVMQLNHFSNKNLKSTHSISVSNHQTAQTNSTSRSFIQLPVRANQPRPSSPPVKIR